MKNFKYLLILILFMPAVVLAAPIHITQSDLDDAYNHSGSINSYTGIKYVTYYGFVFYNNEYTLDENIDLHKKTITSGDNNSLIINLNGYDITQNLEDYDGSGPTISNIDWDYNITINGPGTIYGSYDYDTYETIYNSGGRLTLNNVTAMNSIVMSTNSSESVTTINNSTITGRVIIDDGAVLYVTDSTIQGRFDASDKNTMVTINNSILERSFIIRNDAKVIVDGGELTGYVSVSDYEGEGTTDIIISNALINGCISANRHSSATINNSTLNGLFRADYNSSISFNSSIINSVYGLSYNDDYYESNHENEIINSTFNMYDTIFTSEMNGIYIDNTPPVLAVPRMSPNESNNQNVDEIGIIDPDVECICTATIKKSKISAYSGALNIIGEVDITIDETEVNTSLFPVVSLFRVIIDDGRRSRLSDFPNLTMSDVHLHNDITSMDSPAIMTGLRSKHYDDDDDIDHDIRESDLEGIYNSFLKDGYIYYKDPIFSNHFEITKEYFEMMTGKTLSDDEFEEIKEMIVRELGIDSALMNSDIWVIPKELYIIEDDSLYYIPDDNEVIVVLKGDTNYIEEIEIDGHVLTPDNYTVLELGDKTIGIKIDQDFLRGLEVGDYKVKVVFINGEAESTLNVKDADPVIPTPKEDDKKEEVVKGEVENPKTGLFNYLLLLIPLAIGIITYLKVSNKTIFKRI